MRLVFAIAICPSRIGRVESPINQNGTAGQSSRVSARVQQTMVGAVGPDRTTLLVRAHCRVRVSWEKGGPPG